MYIIAAGFTRSCIDYIFKIDCWLKVKYVGPIYLSYLNIYITYIYITYIYRSIHIKYEGTSLVSGICIYVILMKISHGCVRCMALCGTPNICSMDHRYSNNVLQLCI